MTHAEMNELYDLYALGALEMDAAAEIDAHLRDRCEYCLEHLRESLQLSASLAGLAEAVAPPPAVRERLLSGIRPAKPARRWNFFIPALATACVALLVFSGWSVSQMNGMRRQLDRIIGERDQLRSALEILSRSQTQTVQFGKSDNVAHGRVFVNRNGGFVFVGSELPQIAADKTFELWLVPAKGAPQPVGLFRTREAGDFVHVSQQPIDRTKYAAIAVSVEPKGGSPAPTTKPFLIVPLS